MFGLNLESRCNFMHVIHYKSINDNDSHESLTSSSNQLLIIFLRDFVWLEVLYHFGVLFFLRAHFPTKHRVDSESAFQRWENLKIIFAKFIRCFYKSTSSSELDFNMNGRAIESGVKSES